MTKMTPALPASLAPSPSRLHKPQCHPVALADRLVLRVVRVVVVVARRQGPHAVGVVLGVLRVGVDLALRIEREAGRLGHRDHLLLADVAGLVVVGDVAFRAMLDHAEHAARSEEHTSELQSLMRISYAVFCLKKKKIN